MNFGYEDRGGYYRCNSTICQEVKMCDIQVMNTALLIWADVGMVGDNVMYLMNK